jgi:hypothetical protein
MERLVDAISSPGLALFPTFTVRYKATTNLDELDIRYYFHRHSIIAIWPGCGHTSTQPGPIAVHGRSIILMFGPG